MKRIDGAFVAWSTVACTFGFALFLLFSPTGSHVRTPMEHSKRVAEMRQRGGFMSVQASSADPRIAWLTPQQD